MYTLLVEVVQGVLEEELEEIVELEVTGFGGGVYALLVEVVLDEVLEVTGFGGGV